MISGQLTGSLRNPWATKKADPRPISMNVGKAMESVSRVRMV